jgi:hypothetical protein
MSEFPEIWWSPSLAAKSPTGQAYAGLMWRYESGRGYVTPPNRPDDAVRLVTADVLKDRDLRLMDALVTGEVLADELRARDGAAKAVVQAWDGFPESDEIYAAMDRLRRTLDRADED